MGQRNRLRRQRTKLPPSRSVSVAGTRPLEPAFKLFVNAYRLEESARSCQLCRMMHRSLGAVPLTATIDDVVVSRDGTNLKVSERGRPVLRICAERESPGYQDIHVGLPTLPMAGSELHMSLMKEWLRSCKCAPPQDLPGRHHGNLGARKAVSLDRLAVYHPGRRGRLGARIPADRGHLQLGVLHHLGHVGDRIRPRLPPPPTAT